MLNKSILGAAGMCMSLLSFSAFAVTSYVLNAAGDITGVSELEINGSLWDMTLHDGSFDSLYANVGSAAIYGGQFSYDASTALAQFIQDNYVSFDAFLGCTQINNPGESCYILTNDIYDSTISDAGGNGWAQGFAAIVSGGGTAVLTQGQYTDQIYPDTTNAMWQSHTVIPIPAAVWLFGSGLIGLIGVARRKKS